MNDSKNATRADNQQERLINTGWIVGFVDGEGCFTSHFVKQPDRKELTRIRKGYKTGYQISHNFTVVQGAKSMESLQKLKDFFKVGNIYINQRHDNHKENLYCYVVRKREDLLNVIIPFFEKYRLQTAKKKDFELFAECLYLMESGAHLTHQGAIEIALKCEKMNHQKPRTELIKILRDQMSDMKAIS